MEIVLPICNGLASAFADELILKFFSRKIVSEDL